MWRWVTVDRLYNKLSITNAKHLNNIEKVTVDQTISLRKYIISESSSKCKMHTPSAVAYILRLKFNVISIQRT